MPIPVGLAEARIFINFVNEMLLADSRGAQRANGGLYEVLFAQHKRNFYLSLSLSFSLTLSELLSSIALTHSHTHTHTHSAILR